MDLERAILGGLLVGGAGIVYNLWDRVAGLQMRVQNLIDQLASLRAEMDRMQEPARKAEHEAALRAFRNSQS
jgi:outer membrane murein-binding lipoprotein Lpp